MQFEFDSKKSESNKGKHGIDFVEAQEIWLDPDRVEIPAKQVDGESRFAVIGKVENEFWLAVITYRKTATRIISVRHPNRRQLKFYEESS